MFPQPCATTRCGTQLATTDDPRLDDALSAYRARFETIGIFENSVCPGIQDALESLAGAGHHLSVVTAETGARDNGVHGIAVAWGYAMDGELVAARPDKIVRSPRELVEYVERSA